LDDHQHASNNVEAAMKTKGAVLWGIEQPWSVEEIEVLPPTDGEVLVEWKAAGMCHSEEHFVTGDMVLPEEMAKANGVPSPFPMLGGHEGAGIVVEVGAGVVSVEPGDLVASSFIPACGRCRFCVNGQQVLCMQGAQLMVAGQMSDGVVRHFCRGEALNLYSKCGTFAQHSLLSEQSVVKVDAGLPPSVVSLVSCGVATGWGSAVHAAKTEPGEIVVVVGCGGVGMNAVQGAAMAGAKVVVAVDPVAFKRDEAVKFGATLAYDSMATAIDEIRSMTNGLMADKVIMVPSVLYGEMMAEALTLTRKGGICVLTGVAPLLQTESSINLMQVAMMTKTIRGTLFGSGNPRFDIPNLLSLYEAGQLMLDELVTSTYGLEDINQGFDDMREGKNLRGVIVFD
jgi:S-(hydroxymethyl)glutathione dehydrogenase/alcohol dehydrogenase